MQDEPLDARTRAAVDLLEDLPGRRKVTVVADADVDGTAAAAILVRALQGAGRRFSVVLTRRRDERLLELIQKRAPAFLITADLGATLVPRLTKIRVPAVILDHHEPGGDGDGEGFVHVNPHLVGEDGSAGASGAAVGYRFAQELLRRHGRDSSALLPYALLGAWGDRYHGAEGDKGLHARLVAQARDDTQGRSVTWHAWAPDAGEAVSLADALPVNLDPVVPGLQRPGAAQELLERLGIDGDQPAGALADDERSRFVSWLAAALLEESADAGLLARLSGPRPAFPDGGPLGGLSIPAIALRVDSATRMDRASDALAALLGSGQAWAQLEEGLDVYRDAVTRPIGPASKGAIHLGAGHLVRVDTGWSAGPVADRLMAWTRLGRRPVVVMGSMPHALKFSLRARPGSPWRLDRIAMDAARAAGGSGGGHRLAAGAVVPTDGEARFLEAVQSGLNAAAETVVHRAEGG